MQELEQNNNSNSVPEAKTAETAEATVSETPAESYSHLAASPDTPAVTPHTSRLVSTLEGVAVAMAESTSSSAAVVAIGDTLLGTIPAPGAHAESTIPPTRPEIEKITIDDFSKVELRVAQIIVAERIPKADKLLRLEVNLGYEQRQILAGIAEAYTPESLIGRKVVIVANLLPRKMRGLESNGMIVAASLGEHGKPVLAGFLEDIEIGARLK
jgi:methionyl-tRNA synthetase